MARQDRATTKQAPARTPIESRYLTPEELAVVLNQTARTIKYWRDQEYGPRHTKMGRSVRYAKSEVEKYCADPEGYQHARDMEIKF